MIDELKIEPFLNSIDPNNIRVYQPTSIFLVCGGDREIGGAIAPSLRSAYLRLCDRKPLKSHLALLAEDLTVSFALAHYRDFLRLESDIAQISTLVVLFSESMGSAAELGAFAITDSIAEKLLAIIDSKRFDEPSFIKLGPLLSLQKEYGDEAVCVLNLKDMGLQNIKNLENLNKEAFFEVICSAIRERLGKIKQHSTFDFSQNGHLIKLLVGIIQWYGALTVDEIEICLMYFSFKIEREQIENFLLCADFAGWIKRDKRGVKTYYAAVAEQIAVEFRFPGEKVNRIRWQSEVRQEWKDLEPIRFRAISDAVR